MVIRRHRFLQHLDQLPHQRVVVIGPAVAEVDVRCDVPRLAPDRCMPVYRVDDMSVHPGGAALVAATISGLGARATLIAPVGRGRPGMALRQVLDDHRVTLVEGGDEGVRTPELYRYVTATSGRQLLQVRRGWQPGRFVDLRRALDQAERAGAGAQPINAVCLVDGLPAALTAEDVAVASAWTAKRGIPLIFDAAGAGLVPIPDDVSPEPDGQTNERSTVNAASPRTATNRHFVLNNSESQLFARRLVIADSGLSSQSRSQMARAGQAGAAESPQADVDALTGLTPSATSTSTATGEPARRARELKSRLDAVVVLTLGREGAIVATPAHAASATTETAAYEADPSLNVGDSSTEASDIVDPAAEEVDPSADAIEHRDSTPDFLRLPTNPLPMSDRRGVGFVFSGVYALLIAAGATPAEAAFMASGSATAAAAQPGPKRVSMDGLMKIAYREIESQVADGIEVFDSIARNHLPIIDRAARLLLDAYSDGRQVLVFGNGGSAAEANHLAGELTGRFRQSRPGLPAISLSANDSIATCIANDYGYEHVFARQIDTFCREGDVVIGLTTSGRSANVVSAMERARAIGARTVALVGADPGPLGELADVVVAVPSRSTGRIQEAHLFIIHVMCDMLDRRLDAVGRLQPAASEI